jgi:predicted nucleic acid-binding protein
MMPPLSLSSLPQGTEVLVDANVLTYALQARSQQSRELVRRCKRGEVSGFTTVDTLAEVCHRLMLIEAVGKGLIARPNAANLQGKDHVVRQLTDYWRRVLRLSASGIAILPLDEFRFTRAHVLRQQHGLMTNDSLLLAAADVFGIGALATNDSDFDNIPWMTVYKPTDLA